MGMSYHDLVDAGFAAKTILQSCTDFAQSSYHAISNLLHVRTLEKNCSLVGAFIVEMFSMLAIDFLSLLHITGEHYFIVHRKLDCLPTPHFLQWASSLYLVYTCAYHIPPIGTLWPGFQYLVMSR